MPPSPLLPPPPAGLLLLFGGWPLSPPEDDGWGSSLAAQHCGNLLCLYICALTASEACERGLTLGRQQQLGNSLVAAVVVCACMCSIKKSRYLLPVLTGHVAVCRLPNCMPCAHCWLPTVLLLISKSTWQMDGQVNIQIAFANQFNVTCKQQVNGGTSKGCPVSQIILSQITQAGNEMDVVRAAARHLSSIAIRCPTHGELRSVHTALQTAPLLCPSSNSHQLL